MDKLPTVTLEHLKPASIRPGRKAPLSTALIARSSPAAVIA
jgi:hypothetical protein